MVMRRQNLSLALRQLRQGGPQSRARLADTTGLNKATVSSLVTELLERGLITEGDLARGEVGRPAAALHLSGADICAIGVEVNIGFIAIAALDLTRNLLFEERRRIDGTPDEAFDVLADLVLEASSTVGARQVAGLSIALPGLVNRTTGELLHAPNLGWSHLPVPQLVQQRIGHLDLAVRVDNEVNLAVLEEAAAQPEVDNLVLLSGSSGVGAGVIVDGRLLRGSAGYGGEVGHMPIELQGGLCGCGRRGCWETRVGLTALLRSLAEIGDDILDPALDLEQRIAGVVARAQSGDAHTLNALEQVGTWLGVGAAVLANVLDPEVFVLGGYYAALAPWLLSPMTRELERRAIGADADRYDVRVSTLGFHATVRGAAVASLEAVFTDPTSVPRKSLDQVGA
jgi:predicted NBD/HSP70 family sugar kinase